jgi:hypothetical protein
MKLMRGDMGKILRKTWEIMNGTQPDNRWCRCCCLIHVGDCSAQASVRIFGTNTPTANFAKSAFHARVNVVAFTPLCENLPGPSANKPGDVLVIFCLEWTSGLRLVI